MKGGLGLDSDESEAETPITKVPRMAKVKMEVDTSTGYALCPMLSQGLRPSLVDKKSLAKCKCAFCMRTGKDITYVAYDSSRLETWLGKRVQFVLVSLLHPQVRPFAQASSQVHKSCNNSLADTLRIKSGHSPKGIIRRWGMTHRKITCNIDGLTRASQFECLI